jgi:hypothetical protein
VVVVDADEGDALRPLSSLLRARILTTERAGQGCRRQPSGRQSAAALEEPATVTA